MSEILNVPEEAQVEQVQVEKDNSALEQELASLKEKLKSNENEINSLKAITKEIEALKEQVAKKEESYEVISGGAISNSRESNFNSVKTIDDYINFRLSGGNV